MVPAAVMVLAILLPALSAQAAAAHPAAACPSGELPVPADAQSLAYRVVPRQEDPFGCAHAVAEGIFTLAGIVSGVPAGTGAGRTSLQDLRMIIREGGVDSAAFYLEPDELEDALDAYGPLVLHYDRPVPHFSLALGRAGTGIAVADPAEGLRVIGPAERDSRWSGAVLALAPPADDTAAFRQRAVAAAADAHARNENLSGGSRAELGAALRFEEGSPALSVSLGGQPLPWLRLVADARLALPDRPELRCAAEFDRAISGSAGLTVRTEGSLPAAARLQIRFWAVDDPVAWGAGAGLRAMVEQGVSADFSGSLLYAINACTALGLQFDAELPLPWHAASPAGSPAGSRTGYRVRLQRNEAGFRWWFETGIALPWGNATHEPAGAMMGLGMGLDQKLDST